MNVARFVYFGMAHFNCGKRDVLFFTPKEFMLLCEEYFASQGKSPIKTQGTIDDLP